MTPASALTPTRLPDLPGDEDAEFCVLLTPFLLPPPPLQLLFLWSPSSVLLLSQLFVLQVIYVQVREQGWQFLALFQIEAPHVIRLWGMFQLNVAYTVGIMDPFQIEKAHVVVHWSSLHFEVAHMIGIWS